MPLEVCKTGVSMNISYLNPRSTTLIDGAVPYINIDAFNKFTNIKALFSTRLGGVSTGQFCSMNFCTPLGDSIENVIKNFEIFGNASKLKNFVLSKQTHTTNVIRVDASYINKGLTIPMDYTDVDGLVTNEKNITLSTFYADCVPLYFYDPINIAIGLSHAGWRGTVNNMVKATVDKMHVEFGTLASDLICAIGPSICVNCYEVSEDVASEFVEKFNISRISNYIKNENPFDTSKIVLKAENNKYMINLWTANYTNMIKEGILPDNISFPDLCTCENKELLFSHRALKGKRGNLGAFMMLK